MITIKYTCDKCGIKSREIQVPARETEDQNLSHYLYYIIGRCVSDDHFAVSPHCKAKTITQIAIPAPKEAQFIGQQIE